MQAHGDQRGPTRSGQAVVLAGVATFLIGSFLPFYRLELLNDTVSLARQMVSFGPSDSADGSPAAFCCCSPLRPSSS
jgi:hypothetical protein